MILKYLVSEQVNKTLDGTFKEKGSILKFLKRKPFLEKFIELLHVRVNELDLAGFALTKFAVMDFISKATLHYADSQLEAVEKQLGEVRSVPEASTSSLI